MFVTSRDELRQAVDRAVGVLGRLVAEGEGEGEGHGQDEGEASAARGARPTAEPGRGRTRRTGGGRRRAQFCPDEGLGLEAALRGVEGAVLAHGVRTWAPATAATRSAPRWSRRSWASC